MTQPMQTQIIPNTEPVVHWGVHFLHENVVSDYGPGEHARAAAENTVKEWADSDYPAMLVSQVILPWSKDENLTIPLVMAIRGANTDPRGVIQLRTWLVDNGHETETDRKTGLRHQVPLIKQMRKAQNISHALELLNIWLGTHGYKNS